MRICDACGASSERETEFCASCGNPLTEEASRQAHERMMKRTRRRAKSPEPPFPGYEEHRKRGFWLEGYHYGEQGFFAGIVGIVFGFLAPIAGHLLGAIGLFWGFRAVARDQDFALLSIGAGAVSFGLATLWVVLPIFL